MDDNTHFYKDYLVINNFMKNCFVYEWINVQTGKKYIGYHKGSTDDGYVSSSKNLEFWEDYNRGVLHRHILFEGSMQDCINLESTLLRETDLENLYNRNLNGKIIFTDDVLEKMKNRGKGRKQSEQHIANRSRALKGRSGGFAGKKHSEQTLKLMKSRVRTKEHNQAIGDALRGRQGNFKGKKHKKVSCQYCGKCVAFPGFVRWHGDNCKEKP